MRTEILGVPFDALSMKQAVDRAAEFIREGTENRLVFTPNPEMVMEAQKDSGFMDILKRGDLIVPDGVGIVLASRLYKRKIKISERVAGFDLINGLFEKMSRDGEKISVYLFGGKPGICRAAKETIEARYAGVTVCGYSDGYFDAEKEKIIADDIAGLKPDILLCGLGMAKQEKWIYDQRHLPVKLSIGVGGSLDVFAGAVKRAPVIFQKFGLEWLYRLLSQPSRIGRMMNLPVFAVKVIFESRGE